MGNDQALLNLLNRGGFTVDAYIARLFRLSFLARCIMVPILWAGLFIAGAIIDHSLLLAGPNLGLLQHPTIWTLLVVEALLPLQLRRSLIELGKVPLKFLRIGQHFDFSVDIVEPLLRFSSLRSTPGRLTILVVGITGFSAFVWNSYQNQLPGIIVPFDYWDSIHFPSGYWLTRAYKLYLFAAFLPYVTSLYAGIIWTLLTSIRRRRLSGQIKLNPFSADRVGGLGFVPSIILAPVTVSLLLTAVASVSAFIAYHGVALSPIFGATIILISLFVGYLVPTFYLRTDIVSLKKDSLEELGEVETRLYKTMLQAPDASSMSAADAARSMDYFEHVRVKIESVAEYPYFIQVAGLAGFCFSPSVISIVVGILNNAPLFAAHFSAH